MRVIGGLEVGQEAVVVVCAKLPSLCRHPTFVPLFSVIKRVKEAQSLSALTGKMGSHFSVRAWMAGDGSERGWLKTFSGFSGAFQGLFKS